jgi:hypothetical protein
LSLFLIMRDSHCTPAHQASQTCGPYPPPPSCTFCACRTHPKPHEMGPVPSPNPSFLLHLGPITKGWSTSACSAVGAGPSKVPPQPPYLSLPSTLLMLTSLFLFFRPKEAQHFPARKVFRLPKDPPRSRHWTFLTFSCSAVFPISPLTLLHTLLLCLYVVSCDNSSFSCLTVSFFGLF